jgi:hypothetical protein
LFKAGAQKAEYEALLQQAIAQMRQRHEIVTDLSQMPPVIEELPADAPDDEVARLLVSEDEAKNRVACWHYACELATAELATLDHMDWIVANTKVIIPDNLRSSLATQRQQCTQAMVIAGVEEESVVAALLGMSYSNWLGHD